MDTAHSPGMSVVCKNLILTETRGRERGRELVVSKRRLIVVQKSQRDTHSVSVKMVAVEKPSLETLKDVLCLENSFHARVIRYQHPPAFLEAKHSFLSFQESSSSSRPLGMFRCKKSLIPPCKCEQEGF